MGLRYISQILSPAMLEIGPQLNGVSAVLTGIIGQTRAKRWGTSIIAHLLVNERFS